MNVYLSISSRPDLNFIANICNPSKLNILCSFEYRTSMKQWLPRHCKNFMADSGAFTAMNAGKKIDDKYIGGYVDWIRTNNIEHFMEMDLDEVIGCDKTNKIRSAIESAIGRKSIPVWHIERGGDGWIKMCDNYPYVAISLSGFTKTSKWISKYKYKPLEWLLAQAAQRKTKVHALGCNRLPILQKYHFYSADSTTHAYGRYGMIWQFSNGRITNLNPDKEYKIDKEKVHIHNIEQMIGVMDYAATKL